MRLHWRSAALITATLTTVTVAALCGGCDDRAKKSAESVTGGGADPDRGRSAIYAYGCASCHTIPGIRGADGQVGPSLAKVGGRSYIGGVLANTPDNLTRWITDPPSVDPKTGMPNLHVTEADARDIASYLYTLQ
jgi:cytochrome c1